MKHLLTILSGLLVALLFARCADDDNLSGGIDGLPERGIVIRLSTGELDTRTQLTSTGDYHHVEEVWAVLYKLEGTDANDLTNYKLKGTPTKLGSMEDGQFVAWNPYKAPDAPKFNPADPDNPTDEEREAYEQELAKYNNKWGGEYGNGKVQGREFVLPESGAMEAGTYRVLCIGFDEASKTCYGLQDGGSLTLPTTTLADAYAKLSSKESSKEFGGELFAGWQEFEFEPDNINIVEVELKRRVAGVLCYVNDIPTTITEAGETYTISTIRLCLNTKANDAIHLCRLDDRTKDFGASNGIFTEEKTILAEYRIPEEIIKDHQGEVQGQGKEIFEGNLGQTFEDANVQIKDGSVLLGAYLIPIKHEEGKATLSVELLDANGTVAKTFNAVRSDDPDGELTDESGATIDSQNTTSYDILPNYIYHIGDKDDDIDEPMSLLGQKITVKPKVWTGETIPVEFPSVPIKVTLDYPYLDSYIFDCMNTEFAVNVYSSVLQDDWRLTVLDDPNYRNGIYIRSREPNEEGNYTYSDTYVANSDEAKSGAEVTFFLTDFAQKTDKCYTDVENDYRIMTIRLETLDDNGNAKETVEVEVKQYNAVVVDVEGKARGFARFDMGTYRNRDGSIATLSEPITPNGYSINYGDGLSTGWGYWSWAATNSNIYGVSNVNRSDGKANYMNATNANISGYEGSAIDISYKPMYNVSSSEELESTSEYWYLPASEELEGFLTKSLTNSLNVKVYSSAYPNYRYWTSEGGPQGESECRYIENSSVKEERVPRGEKDRQYQLFIRQACHIDN